MIYGIIADIHSNLEAFEAVLHELRQVDQLIGIGDIVGYGPDPNECIRLAQENKIYSIAGNHDKAAVGEMDTQWFNENARRAIRWTGEQLTESNIKYLKSLPLNLEADDFQVVHGSLRNPLEEYVTTLDEAEATMELMTRPLCFVGHSHQPFYAGKMPDGKYEGRSLKDNETVIASRFSKIIINPGGLGQPRDGDPRASFGVYDSDKKEFILHRVEYNVEKVQGKMRAAGLPAFLVERLQYGR
jgi:diadenosine tetraphosphatase ApaH/serine/threonine PP2A family protein phosphatase